MLVTFVHRKVKPGRAREINMIKVIRNYYAFYAPIDRT